MRERPLWTNVHWESAGGEAPCGSGELRRTLTVGVHRTRPNPGDVDTLRDGNINNTLVNKIEGRLMGVLYLEDAGRESAKHNNV